MPDTEVRRAVGPVAVLVAVGVLVAVAAIAFSSRPDPDPISPRTVVSEEDLLPVTVELTFDSPPGIGKRLGPISVDIYINGTKFGPQEAAFESPWARTYQLKRRWSIVAQFEQHESGFEMRCRVLLANGNPVGTPNRRKTAGQMECGWIRPG